LPDGEIQALLFDFNGTLSDDAARCDMRAPNFGILLEQAGGL